MKRNTEKYICNSLKIQAPWSWSLWTRVSVSKHPFSLYRKKNCSSLKLLTLHLMTGRAEMMIFPLLLSVSFASPCWVVSLTPFSGNLNKTAISLGVARSYCAQEPHFKSVTVPLGSVSWRLRSPFFQPWRPRVRKLGTDLCEKR